MSAPRENMPGPVALVIAVALIGLPIVVVPIAGLALASQRPDVVLDPSRPVAGVSTIEVNGGRLTPLDVPEPNGRSGSLWARVVSPAMARVTPGLDAEPVARLSVQTPEGSPSIVSVLATAKDAVGYAWVKVRVPGLPNGREGWVARTALGGSEVSTSRLVVDTNTLTASLERGGQVVLSVPVGIGADQWPTPRGEFIVRSSLTRYKSPQYGPIAFGTTARSPVLTDWPGGGVVGIHGTDRPDLLPGRVSHGCIRMRNDDILRLARLMPIGTPLLVV
jgi:L,D-transpeptidase catalytic domain